MNKEEFLLYIERHLSVLNEKERSDIILEYAQHIDMKVQSGQTEAEAIKDFGKPEALVDEILEAYNLDPDYGKNSSKSGGIHIFDGISGGNMLKITLKMIFAAVVLMIIGSAGFTVVAEIVDSLPKFTYSDVFEVVMIGAYSIGAVIVAIFMMYCYLLRLTEAARNGNGGNFFETLQKKVNSVLDFISSQSFGALIVMFIKICVAAAILAFTALCGTVIPSVIGSVLNFAENALTMLYVMIIVPICAYTLYRYIIKLADSMSQGKKPVKEKAAEPNKNDEMWTITYFVKSFIKLILKGFAALMIFFAACASIPAIAFAGLTLVFAIMGYPCIGICLMCVGAAMCGISFVIFTASKLFKKNKEASL